MQRTDTITITIPTAKILVIGAGLLAGLVIGAGLAYAGAHGFHELWMPVVMMPGYLTRHQARTAPAPLRLVASRSEAVARAHAALAAAGIHPAIAAFDAVPAPVRAALDQLVEHVLAEKYRTAA
jgi:hypothetical protein